jgi:hypothetical protein
MERQSHHELANVTLPLSKNHTGANADRRGRAQFHCRSGTAPPQLLHTTNVAPPLSPFQHLETTRGAERQAIWKAQSTDGEKEEKSEDAHRPGRLSSDSEACAASLSMSSWLARRTGPSTPAHALYTSSHGATECTPAHVREEVWQIPVVESPKRTPDVAATDGIRPRPRPPAPPHRRAVARAHPGPHPRQCAALAPTVGAHPRRRAGGRPRPGRSAPTTNIDLLYWDSKVAKSGKKKRKSLNNP